MYIQTDLAVKIIINPLFSSLSIHIAKHFKECWQFSLPTSLLYLFGGSPQMIIISPTVKRFADRLS